ncbi:hypothetical protein PVL29_001512 [Vitis rotundifolia]|uniref:Nucleotide exchange factor Fes1 domain-containing protein n=1 Tax=Vitis rotundifolia TaxID=103349 RepID=A0AA39AMZ5_VITRO|nr:hypothetical protein PVL29_001512 [Vitis rotundifolia]
MMGRSASGLALWLLLLASAGAVMAQADRVNKSSSGGLFWSTAKEEGDLMRKSEAQESTVGVDDNADLDGGFSSLDGMLQWAIGRWCFLFFFQLLELMEKLKMPSDAQLMQIAIADLNNSSLPMEDHHRALQELLILVEPIDNANDLNKLGGLTVVIRELDNPDPEIRKISAWILGKASQNNPVVQEQVLELGALQKLMKMVNSSFVEEATKALYAVSALIRKNLAAQELFYAKAGDLMLQDILSNPSIDIRLRRKTVFLVGDLAECQLESTHKAELPFFSNRHFLKSVVDLIASSDLDLQEKALVAVKNLLQLRTTEALVFKDYCDLDGALERMRKQLQQLMEDEYKRDYVMDLESLRREVGLVFHQKLGKVTHVPT